MTFNEEMLTVSENRSSSSPVFKSRSNWTTSGGNVSDVKLTGKLFTGLTSSTGFAFVSLTVRLVMAMTVFRELVARVEMFLMIFASSKRICISRTGEWSLARSWPLVSV